MYLSHLNHSTAESGKLGFLVLNENKGFYYFEYNNDDDDIRRINIILTPPFKSSHYIVVGYFNGLDCLYGYQDYAYYICNRVTREYVMLPSIKRDFGDQHFYHSSGFGYLPLTNEYKVVELYILSESKFIEVVVYTLGSGNGRRNVGRLEFMCLCYADPVYVNGAVHWLDYVKGGVLVFVLTEEKFRQHLSPPPMPYGGMPYSFNKTIGELGRVLYYGINLVRVHFDIWLLKEKNDNLDMEDQVEHEPLGWRKEFSLPGRKPLTFTKSGGVLFSDDKSLAVYDATSSTSKKLLELTLYLGIFPHKNTLVSLKELGEEEIQIMKSDEIEEQKALISRQSSK
ncbi:F-box/kelch-repeat protein At3g06240-like [Papaver somniferum]|uniref:F-box/kelch-repeat protein At3g06240-like n=1 Tax=Papaver somniferum TaxID=3469 RepID=UPI000E700FB4|nr:F-box/kelch-repeat protein At3g06240-like [Papaver somniferum]